jgi:hypothetical protein
MKAVISQKPQQLARLAASLNQQERQKAFQQIVDLSAPEFLAFAKEVNLLRGWGRGLQKAVGRWYARFTPAELQAQITGSEVEHIWVWRRAHVVPATEAHSELFGRVIEQEAR